MLAPPRRCMRAGAEGAAVAKIGSSEGLSMKELTVGIVPWVSG